MRFLHANWLLAIFALISVADQIHAQQPKGSPARLAADVVTLSDGTRLYGVILKRAEHELSLLVERSWLSRNLPGVYGERQVVEQQQFRQAQEQLVSRIRNWIAERSNEKNLVVFLQDELSRANAVLASQPDLSHKRFMVLGISSQQIQRVVQQTGRQRQVLGVAWKHNLRDASIRKTDLLVRELEKLQIDINAETYDFASQVPGLGESDLHWNVRKAIVEYELVKPVEFHGQGKTFFRKGQQVDQESLIGQLLGRGLLSTNALSQLGQELGIPEFRPTAEPLKRDDDSWKQKLISQAESEGARGFLVLRLDQSLAAETVSVEANFFAKLDVNQWRPVFQKTTFTRIDQQDDQQIAQLKDDPQVKQIIELANGIGLGGAAIERALRQGAAVQTALRKNASQTNALFERYARRLDTPPTPEFSGSK